MDIDKIEIIAFEDSTHTKELCRVVVKDVQMSHDAMEIASLDASRRANLDIKARAIIRMYLADADRYPKMDFAFRPIKDAPL